MDLDFRRNVAVLGPLVDMMLAGVFTVDAAGCFVAWSLGAERITGYAAADLVGRPCSLLEGPNCKGFGALADLLREPDSAQNRICSQECKVLSRDGREVHIHGNVQLLRDANGCVQGAVGCFMDVTALVNAHQKIAVLEKQTVTGFAFEELVGNSDAMREVFRQLKIAADSDVTVLLVGESGTGKELAARAIHQQSPRRHQPFIAINCSAIPESLLESELFGHAKGAFTGAHADQIGVFEAANGGTLFLDEIGDVSPAIQVKLLRVLQEREVRRLGEHRTRMVDVRLITATNRDLMQLISTEKIREDFYYRIHVFEIRLPPLRERTADIPLLVEHFVQELCQTKGRSADGIARDALDQLLEYPWPGNVRELRNAIEFACATAAGDRISYFDLPPKLREQQEHTPTQLDLTPEQQAERNRIVDALRHTGGNRTKAAEMLGTSRVTLWKKIGRYGIEISGS